MDPGVFDPQKFDLALVLTAAGVPIAAAVIASLIQILKRVPFVTNVVSTTEGARSVNLILCAGLIAYAAAAIGVQLTLVSGFMLFLAWINLVGFTDKAYVIAPDSVKAALGGSAS